MTILLANLENSLKHSLTAKKSQFLAIPRIRQEQWNIAPNNGNVNLPSLLIPEYVNNCEFFHFSPAKTRYLEEKSSCTKLEYLDESGNLFEPSPNKQSKDLPFFNLLENVTKLLEFLRLYLLIIKKLELALDIRYISIIWSSVGVKDTINFAFLVSRFNKIFAKFLPNWLFPCWKSIVVSLTSLK